MYVENNITVMEGTAAIDFCHCGKTELSEIYVHAVRKQYLTTLLAISLTTNATIYKTQFLRIDINRVSDMSCVNFCYLMKGAMAASHLL